MGVPEFLVDFETTTPYALKPKQEFIIEGFSPNLKDFDFSSWVCMNYMQGHISLWETWVRAKIASEYQSKITIWFKPIPT
jgi:hypothetical protein